MPWDTASPEYGHSHLTLSPRLKEPWVVLPCLFPFTLRRTRSAGSAQLFGTCQGKLVAEGCHPEGTLAQLLLPPPPAALLIRPSILLACLLFSGLGCWLCQDRWDSAGHRGLGTPLSLKQVELDRSQLAVWVGTVSTSATFQLCNPGHPDPHFPHLEHGVPPISRLKIKCSSNTWHTPHTEEPAEKPSTASAGA